MGLWDKVKSAIVEDDGTVEAAAPQGAPQPQMQKVVRTNEGGTMTSYHPVAPAVNQEMVAAIRKQTFSRNTALTALITASDALADIIPDPAMRLKAAQKTAGAGRGAKELAEAVQIHLNDVDGAEMQFGQALEGKIKQEVGGLQRQADVAEQSVQTMNQRIQQLQQEIQNLQQQSAEQSTNAMNLRSQAASKEAELRQADTEFKAAANAVRQELNSHKATILSTLG